MSRTDQPRLQAPLLVVVCSLLAAPLALGRPIWTVPQADDWYAHQPWMIGANYIPASAVNQLEMWQPATFDPDRVDRELGWAEKIGMNTLRVFLHDLLWQQDAAGFRNRIDQFLALASKHHMRVLFVLFDSCWEPEPKLGPQNPPISGVHNSRWVQSPGMSALMDRSQERRLETYVKGVVGAFAQDPRVVGWDLWNEPSNSKQGLERVHELLPKVFAWARSADPVQPLTSGVFQEGTWDSGRPTPVENVQLMESDVISFHDYHWPEVFMRRASRLRALGRPLWCTEYLARGAGSTFEGSLPPAKQLNVAMINWGLVDGRTQTRLPWDSWTIPYVNGREPVVWHHEVVHADGTPYRQTEVDLIHAIASAPKGALPPPMTLR